MGRGLAFKMLVAALLVGTPLAAVAEPGLTVLEGVTGGARNDDGTVWFTLWQPGLRLDQARRTADALLAADRDRPGVPTDLACTGNRESQTLRTRSPLLAR